MLSKKRDAELMEQAARAAKARASRLSRADDEVERLLARTAEIEAIAAQLRRESEQA